MLPTEEYFKTAEFANICGTTKRTLFYYDEIGLLKPAYVDENSCRYYQPEQRMTYILINSLKEIGMQLKDIQAYLQAPNAEDFFHILRKQQKMIEAQQEKLLRIQNIINTRSLMLEQIKRVSATPIQIECSEEEYFILSDAINQPDSRLEHEVLFAHLKYCHLHNYGDGHPFSAMISSELLEKGITDTYAYYCTKVNQYFPESRLHIKPSGLYAVSYLFGDYRKHHSFYLNMVDEIHRRGYVCSGYSYKEAISDEITASDSNQYITKVSIQLKDAGVKFNA